MGIFNKIRGGAGSNHYSGRNDYPYAGDGAPSQPADNGADEWVRDASSNRPTKHEFPSDLYTHRITDGNFSKETMSPQSGAASAPSGRGRYLLKGGGYIRTTPTAGKEGRHDVTTYSDDHKPQYSVSDASFHHDEEAGTASFFGGVDYSSGQRMSHKWEKPTWSGNLHRDDEFGG